MVERTQRSGVAPPGYPVDNRAGCRSAWCITLVMLLTSLGLLTNDAGAGAARHRPIRIGALTTSWGPTPLTAGLRDGLLELGYRDGEDFVIGVRFTQGNHEELSVAARQLVQYDVDLIFSSGALTAQAAKMATTQIPIVFAAVSDPVGSGLIQSYARPGGNITGVSDLGFELGPKSLELFRQLIPGLQRVLFPYDATSPYHLAELKVYRSAAHQLGIELVEKPLRTEGEAKTALAQIQQGEVDGILSPRCCFLNIPGFILDMATQKALPTMFRQAFWVERGALASYGPDYYASGRQAARLVDKVLNGTTPADIPVEVNPRIEFVINRKVAKALGLTVAPEVLFRADKLVH